MKSLLLPFQYLGYLAIWVIYIIGALILFLCSLIEFFVDSFRDAVFSRKVTKHPLDEDYLRSEWD